MGPVSSRSSASTVANSVTSASVSTMRPTTVRRSSVSGSSSSIRDSGGAPIASDRPASEDQPDPPISSMRAETRAVCDVAPRSKVASTVVREAPASSASSASSSPVASRHSVSVEASDAARSGPVMPAVGDERGRAVDRRGRRRRAVDRLDVAGREEGGREAGGVEVGQVARRDRVVGRPGEVGARVGPFEELLGGRHLAGRRLGLDRLVGGRGGGSVARVSAPVDAGGEVRGVEHVGERRGSEQRGQLELRLHGQVGVGVGEREHLVRHVGEALQPGDGGRRRARAEHPDRGDDARVDADRHAPPGERVELAREEPGGAGPVLELVGAR